VLPHVSHVEYAPLALLRLEKRWDRQTDRRTDGRHTVTLSREISSFGPLISGPVVSAPPSMRDATLGAGATTVQPPSGHVNQRTKVSGRSSATQYSARPKDYDRLTKKPVLFLPLRFSTYRGNSSAYRMLVWL